VTESVRAVITGTGSYAPSKVLTNEDLERMVQTSDEWIVTRTGIKRRHVVENGYQATSDLALEASRKALEMASVNPGELDMIIVATVTPDRILPSTASILQAKLGAEGSGAFDIAAACAGFLHGLTIARSLILCGNCKKILVVGAEVLTSITNYDDRSTCVLFGDGAGAVVVELREQQDDIGIMSSYLKADGTREKLLWVPSGGVAEPLTEDNVNQAGRYVNMQGNEIFKLAVRAMCDAAEKSLRDSGLNNDNISWLIPHQANIRIINAVAKKLNLPTEKVYYNIHEYGNTSAASVPLALDEANRGRLLKKGDNILMVAFGGGLTWGAALVRWDGS